MTGGETEYRTAPGQGDPGLFGQFAVLEAVSLYGTYSAAAKALGLASPSGAQRRFRALAATLGVDLGEYDRRQHRVVFTKAGEDAVALAKEMNAGVARLMASEAVAGEVKVASFPAHVTNVLAHAARRTQVRHPGTRFVWSANEAHRADGGSSLVSRMEAGEFDVVVCSKGARGVPAKRSAELYRWELCAVGQGLGPEVTLDGLVGREIGTSPERHLSRTLLDGELSRRSLRIQEAFAKPIETESTEALLALAIEGFLVAIVPSDSVPAGVTWTRLRLAGGRTRGGAYVMAWCEDPSAAVADFVTEATSWGDALGQVPLVPLSGSAPG